MKAHAKAFSEITPPEEQAQKGFVLFICVQCELVEYTSSTVEVQLRLLANAAIEKCLAADMVHAVQGQMDQPLLGLVALVFGLACWSARNTVSMNRWQILAVAG